MKQIEYVVCPLCGRNRVIEEKTKGKGQVRWDFWDKDKSPIIQIREGGGSKSLDELPPEQRQKYRLKKYRGKILDQMRKQIQKLQELI